MRRHPTTATLANAIADHFRDGDAALAFAINVRNFVDGKSPHLVSYWHEVVIHLAKARNHQ